MSAWLVKTRRAPSRHSRHARVYGHTTTTMHKLSTPPVNRQWRIVPGSGSDVFFFAHNVEVEHFLRVLPIDNMSLGRFGTRRRPRTSTASTPRCPSARTRRPACTRCTPSQDRPSRFWCPIGPRRLSCALFRARSSGASPAPR